MTGIEFNQTNIDNKTVSPIIMSNGAQVKKLKIGNTEIYHIREYAYRSRITVTAASIRSRYSATYRIDVSIDRSDIYNVDQYNSINEFQCNIYSNNKLLQSLGFNKSTAYSWTFTLSANDDTYYDDGGYKMDIHVRCYSYNKNRQWINSVHRAVSFPTPTRQYRNNVTYDYDPIYN